MPLWWIEIDTEADIDLEGLGCTVYTYDSSSWDGDTALVEVDNQLASRIRQLPGVTTVERPRDATYTDPATEDSYVVSGNGTSITKAEAPASED
jgi:hypothetical protein